MDVKILNHIHEDMIVKTDTTRAYKSLFKGIMRYPLHFFRKSRLHEDVPNVYMGYTDHPIDINTTPFYSLTSFLRRYKDKKTACVLCVSLRESRNQTVVFDAKGYDVFKIIDFEAEGVQHTYKFNDKTKYTPLTLQLDFTSPSTYRLRLSHGKSVPVNNTPMIEKLSLDNTFEVKTEDNEDSCIISTSVLKLVIKKQNFMISVYDHFGSLITETGSKTKNEFANAFDAFPLGLIKDKKTKKEYSLESFVLYPGEAIYGLGEHFGTVNKIGSTTGQWIVEGFGNTSKRSYKQIPFFMSTRGYGVFINESKPATLWIGTREVCKNQIAVEGNYLDYFFFYGPTLKKILSSYTELTGRATVPPRWTYGTWMSRWTYFTQEQVLDAAKALREMKIPCDVIHIDCGWFRTDRACDWMFDKTRFPEPQKMFAEAARLGFKISLWQLPYVMEDTSVYADAKKNKVLAKLGDPFIFHYMFPCRPIDFSKSEAIEWYKEKLRNVLKLGAAAIKVDFGDAIDLSMKFSKYDAITMHNLYPLLYNKAAFEAVKEEKGEGVIWARPAFAGSQRYPIHWSGDNSSNYENLLCSLRGGLCLGLSGFTFWSQDSGGFAGAPTDENLYIRWTQLSIFQSHLRYHGPLPFFNEPWNYTKQTQDRVRTLLELRYRLIPYLFSESFSAVVEGIPIMRHLVLEYQDDPTVFNIEDEFLCGRNILIAPILTKENKRTLYLPEGDWYNYWSGEKFSGRKWISVECEIDSFPLYVKAGTILPLGTIVQNTVEMHDDEFTLMVYPNSEGNASYTLQNEKGSTEFKASLSNDTMKISVKPEIKTITINCTKNTVYSKFIINDKVS